MSDLVKIRVKYSNQDTAPTGARVSTRARPISSGNDGGDRGRGPTPLLFAVIGILVAGGIGAGLLYATESGPSSSPPIAAPTVEPETVGAQYARASDAQSEAVKAKATASTESLARFETAARTPASRGETVSSRPVEPPPADIVVSEAKVPVAEAPKVPTPDSATLPPPVKRPATATQKLATEEAIHSGSVARSQLTSAVRGREPVDRLSSRVKIGEEGRRKLFYFTELQGLNGETIFHRWEHDGQTVVTLRFNVGSDRWRAYSSKMIPADQAGDWRVLVANAQGDVLASSQFVAE